MAQSYDFQQNTENIFGRYKVQKILNLNDQIGDISSQPLIKNENRVLNKRMAKTPIMGLRLKNRNKIIGIS